MSAQISSSNGYNNYDNSAVAELIMYINNLAKTGIILDITNLIFIDGTEYIRFNSNNQRI